MNIHEHMNVRDGRVIRYVDTVADTGKPLHIVHCVLERVTVHCTIAARVTSN